MRKNPVASSSVKEQKFNPKPYQRPGLSQQQIIEIKEAFDIFDPEQTGQINPKDIKASIDSLGFEYKNNTVYQLILDYDADGAGVIQFQDFIHLMSSRVTENDPRQQLRKVFTLFDDEKTGYISIKNLRRIARELGDTIQQYELQEMIDRADQDKDGLINEEEFYSIITRKL